MVCGTLAVMSARFASLALVLAAACVHGQVGTQPASTRAVADLAVPVPAAPATQHPSLASSAAQAARHASLASAAPVAPDASLLSSSAQAISSAPAADGLVCAGEETCLKVQAKLETVRRNIGGWCGTPDAMAHHELVNLGTVVVPYLERALGDPDLEVAEFASSVLLDLGARGPVEAWCAGPRARPAHCDRLAKFQGLHIPIDVTGRWSGTPTTTTLVLRREGGALVGELCVAGGLCYPLERVAWIRNRLTFDYEEPAGTRWVDLVVDRSVASGSGFVLWRN